VFGQITDKLARDVVSRVLALVDESAKPIQIWLCYFHYSACANIRFGRLTLADACQMNVRFRQLQT
jgi:hypothetical protein